MLGMNKQEIQCTLVFFFGVFVIGFGLLLLACLVA